MTRLADAKTEKPITFKSSEDMERWLERNHLASKGIWIRMFRKSYRKPYMKGSDALDIALCYGWITGQARPYDSISVLWRFCPRRPKSLWSKINTGHAERLIREGRMKEPGLREIEAAKKDGRWENAYHPQSTATLPEDFTKALSKDKKAREFFKTLNKSNRYAIIFRIATIRTASGRKAKISSIIAMLHEGKSYH